MMISCFPLQTLNEDMRVGSSFFINFFIIYLFTMALVKSTTLAVSNWMLNSLRQSVVCKYTIMNKFLNHIKDVGHEMGNN